MSLDAQSKAYASDIDMADSAVELLPGTELMRDVDGAHFVHAHNSGDAAVLVPQPSNDPNDPLVSPFLAS